MTQSLFWKDVRAQATGNSVGQAIGILGLPLLTRLYTPEEMAGFTVFQHLVMFFAGVMTLRYEQFVQLPKDDKDAFGLVRLVCLLAIVVSAVLVPLMFLVGPLFGSMMPTELEATVYRDWLWLAPLTAAVISIALALQNMTQRFGDFTGSALSEVIGKLAYVGVGVVGGGLGAGMIGILSTLGGAGIAKVLTLARRGSCHLPEVMLPVKNVASQLPFIRDLARRHYHLSGGMVASHLLGTVTALTPVLHIQHAYGQNALGQFGLISMTIYLPASLVGSAIGQVFYQRAAQQWAAGQTFATLWIKTFVKLATIGLPTYAAIAILAPIAYPLVFGGDWEEAGRLAPVMAIAAGCAFMTTPMEKSCVITGMWRYQVAWFAARAASTVGIAVWAAFSGWSFAEFVVALVVQMCTLYLLDLCMEYRFSRLIPGCRDGDARLR